MTRILSSVLTVFVLLAAPVFAEEHEEKREVIEMTMGAEDAPVTLIEYASFTCPHCRSFHETVFPQLKADYIDTGKIKFVHREVYFDRLGLWGGLLARCAGPEKYFGIADLLYKRQAEWSRGEDAATIVQNLFTIGKLAGMDEQTMDACLQDRDHALALVDVFQKTTEEHGVNSTPSLVINGTTYGNQSYAQLQALIDAELGE